MTLSFKQEENLDLVKDARTDNWPTGLACKNWKNIEHEFCPGDVLAEEEYSWIDRELQVGTALERGHN